MIVIEGFDCSGKSSLANRIGEELAWPVMHAGGPPASYAAVIEGLTRCRQRWMQCVVQDRITHISESAYSHLSSPYTAARALDSIRMIPSTVMVIYCRPPTDFLIDAFKNSHTRQAWDTDEHLEQVHGNAQSIIAFYDTVMAIVTLHTRVYVYNRVAHPDANDIIAAVKTRFLNT